MTPGMLCTLRWVTRSSLPSYIRESLWMGSHPHHTGPTCVRVPEFAPIQDLMARREPDWEGWRVGSRLPAHLVGDKGVPGIPECSHVAATVGGEELEILDMRVHDGGVEGGGWREPEW